MRSALPGIRISSVEVTNVSPNGLWLLLDAREVFLPFQHFPWFEDASIRAIRRVERPSPHHLYWPELDIDLAVESIDHPERYPLVSGARSNMQTHEHSARHPRRAGTQKPLTSNRGGKRDIGR